MATKPSEPRTGRGSAVFARPRKDGRLLVLKKKTAGSQGIFFVIRTQRVSNSLYELRLPTHRRPPAATSGHRHRRTRPLRDTKAGKASTRGVVAHYSTSNKALLSRGGRRDPTERDRARPSATERDRARPSATERDRARPSATERRERRERVSVSKSQLQFDSS